MKQLLHTLFVLAIFSLMASCGDHDHSHNGHHHDHSHDHEHKFEDMVDHLEDPERDEWQQPQKVLDLMGELNDKRILDIGAGTGYFSFPLTERGAIVTAADISDKSVQFINDRKKELGTPDSVLMARVIPADDPAVSPAEFDAALIVNTYHHIENRVKYFRILLEGLTSEGVLYVVDFKNIPLPVGPPMEMKLPAEKVVYELQQAGYTGISVESDLLKYQYIVKAYKDKKPVSQPK